MKKEISDLQARGGRFVVMDPRRTETAEVADEHHFIIPGSDAFFLFALINVLFDEGLTDLGRLADFTDDVGRVRELSQPFSPEDVAAATGIPADTIRRIAREFAGAERAVCYGRIGTCTQEFGTLASWLVDVVNAKALDNLIRRGLKVPVLFTEDQWFGVTYQADGPQVINELKKMIEIGIYPSNLWG